MLEGPKFDMHALGNHHNNNYDAFTQDFYQKLGEEGTNMSIDSMQTSNATGSETMLTKKIWLWLEFTNWCSQRR